jgi:hypothetical protein
MSPKRGHSGRRTGMWFWGPNQPGRGSLPDPSIRYSQWAGSDIWFDPSLDKALVSNVVKQLTSTVGPDISFLQQLFPGIAAPVLNYYLDGGDFGAFHDGCANTDIHLATFSGTNLPLVSSMLVAEAVEVFSAGQNRGWNCGHSNGESLSRVIAAARYPSVFTPPFVTAPTWLDGRTKNDTDDDYVNQTFIGDKTKREQGDEDPHANGCGTLFLNFLHDQLGFSWDKIVSAGGTTLADTYRILTGRTNAFSEFAALMQHSFPVGTPSKLTSDNPFPLPNVPAPPGPTQPDRLLRNQALLVDQSIGTADGRLRVVLQSDGNLVLYNQANAALWATNTNGASVWDLEMQSDGNLVVYDVYRKPLWASNTGNNPGAILVVQNDGNVVIYDASGHALWDTKTFDPPLLTLTLQPPAGTNDDAPHRKITVFAKDSRTGASVNGTVSISGKTGPTGTEIDYPGCVSVDPRTHARQYVPCKGSVTAPPYATATFSD